LLHLLLIVEELLYFVQLDKFLFGLRLQAGQILVDVLVLLFNDRLEEGLEFFISPEVFVLDFLQVFVVKVQDVRVAEHFGVVVFL